MFKIEKKIVAINTYNGEGLNPEYADISEEEVVRYLAENPFPKEEKAYSAKDLIYDLTQSGGMYSLPDGVREETIEFIEKLLNKVI